MIDASKLLSRPTSNGLSRDSVQNLVVIKKKVIEVDNLLKERLVLRKVREGILRQQEERERRFARETTLEKRDVKEKDSDYDITNPTKPKKGTGGLIGGIVSTVLSSFNFVAFSKIGGLLKIGKLLKLLVSPKTLILVGALTLLTKIVSNVSTLRNIPSKDLNAVGGNKVQSGFESFQSSIEELANALLVTAGLNFATARINKRRLRDQGISLTSGQLRRTGQEAKRRRIKMDEAYADAMARADAEFDADEFYRQRANNQSIEVATESATDATSGGKKKTYSKPQRVPVSTTMGAGIDPKRLKQMGLDPSITRFGTQVPGATRTRPTPTGGGISASKSLRPDDPLFIKGGLNKSRRLSLIKRLNRELGLSIPVSMQQSLLKQSDSEFMRFFADQYGFDPSEGFGAPQGEIFKPFKPKKPKKTPKKRNLFPKAGDPNTPEVKRVQAKIDAKNPTFVSPETGGRLPVKRTKKISAEALTGATDKATKKAIQKATRKSIMEGISLIPFIGDLVGLLIDIFVFGEPPGRAAFMAVGGALGGFLGALLGGIGGPPGAIIASILGGIAGDLLGGLLYDVLFRSDRKNPFLRLPKIGLKEAIKKVGLYKGGFAPYGNYVLGEQGREFVLDADSTRAVEDNYPGFLAALNKSDYDGALTVLRSHAFYETGAGFERMVPIPIPIQAPSDPFVRTNTVVLPVASGSVNKTYFQLYRRG